LRAAWYEATGPARGVLRVGALPDPTPGPGEVLVAVAASGINPHDTKRRAGWRGMVMPFPRVVPQADGAGVIRAVGPGVPASRVGERVWLWGGLPARPMGTAAELCAVAADRAVSLPDGIEFADGACLGVPACTAHKAVFADGSVAGKTVLVSGAAGAVGHFAAQMAASDGARVIATVSSPEKAAHARAAGATHVIDYRHEDVAARIRDIVGSHGVDRIIEVDFGANAALDASIIAEHGVIAAYSSTSQPEPVLPYYPLQHKAATLRFIQGLLLNESARRAAVDAITAGLRAGKLKATIARRFPLAEIAAAHEHLESGQAMGKVIVEIS